MMNHVPDALDELWMSHAVTVRGRRRVMGWMSSSCVGSVGATAGVIREDAAMACGV